jgi:hypothetical protein
MNLPKDVSPQPAALGDPSPSVHGKPGIVGSPGVKGALRQHTQLIMCYDAMNKEGGG